MGRPSLRGSFPGEWTNNAACRYMDVALFFHDSRQSPKSQDALDMCKDCPVKQPCLDHAIRNQEVGIWGGTTVSERTAMRRRIQRNYDYWPVA